MEQPLPDTRPADDGLLNLSFFLSAFIALFKVLSQGAIGGDPALLLSDSCTRNAGTIQKFGFIKMQPYMELIKKGGGILYQKTLKLLHLRIRRKLPCYRVHLVPGPNIVIGSLISVFLDAGR